MEYLYCQTKHILLLRDYEMDGVICPIRLEVTFFSDGSVFTNEIMETPKKSFGLNPTHHLSVESFKHFCPEAADLIEKNKKV